MIKKNLLFIIIILALIGGGVAWYISRPSSVDLGGVVPVGIVPQVPTSSGSQFAEVRNKILQNIALLKRVRLDTTILDDPAFLSLREAPEPPPKSLQVQRRNPFLPIGQ